MMITRSMTIGLAAISASCTAPAPPAQSNAQSSSAPAPAAQATGGDRRPTWSASAPLLRSHLSRIIGADPARPYDLVRPDSLTEGEISDALERDGSVRLYTLPDDRVWQLHLGFGMADRCRRPTRDQVRAFVTIAAPAADRAEVDRVAARLANDPRGPSATIHEHELPGARIRAVGDCVTMLIAVAT